MNININFNELALQVHANAKAKGFWDAWLLTFAVFFLDIAVFWLGVWAVYSYFF